jgi:hypothetical protein
MDFPFFLRIKKAVDFDEDFFGFPIFFFILLKKKT